MYYPCLRMTNQNITQRGTQRTGLSVMIGRCSSDIHHGGPVGILRMLTVLFFMYTNNEQSNHTNQKHKHSKWTREDNKPALPSSFRTNPIQTGHRKRMVEIWEECARFKTTSQRLAGQVRRMIKKGWFFDLEILQIHQRVNREWRQHIHNIIIDTPNTKKQDIS